MPTFIPDTSSYDISWWQRNKISIQFRLLILLVLIVGFFPWLVGAVTLLILFIKMLL